MRALLTTLVLLQLSLSLAQAQACNCEQEFLFVKQYLERNHPGLNAAGGRQKAWYQTAARALQSEIKKANPQTDCILYLQDYFSLIKDHHIFINPPVPTLKRFDRSSPRALDSLYQSAAFKATPMRKVDSLALVNQLVLKTEKDLEGWYKDPNDNLIAVVKEPGQQWSYAGIVVSSKTKVFPVGTVRYQFRQRGSGALWSMVVLPDHQKLYTSVSLSAAGIPNIGLTRATIAPPEVQHHLNDTTPFAFSALNEQTNYLRVSSFEGHLTRTLDSLYRAIDGQIRSKPFLIIDIRNNRGGSDGSFMGLLNYLYTNPIYSDTAELWVSPDNIKRYEEVLAMKKANANRYSQESIASDESLVRRMKAARPFTFISQTTGSPGAITADSILKYPAKIIVLMNKGCASSAEAFIYYAKQSRKVITMGENSGGFMGFGNVRNSQTPCFHYPFGATTSKYRNFSKYEFVGIPPDMKLSEKQDWIAAAVKALEH